MSSKSLIGTSKDPAEMAFQRKRAEIKEQYPHAWDKYATE